MAVEKSVITCKLAPCFTCQILNSNPELELCFRCRRYSIIWNAEGRPGNGPSFWGDRMEAQLWAVFKGRRSGREIQKVRPGRSLVFFGVKKAVGTADSAHLLDRMRGNYKAFESQFYSLKYFLMYRMSTPTKTMSKTRFRIGWRHWKSVASRQIGWWFWSKHRNCERVLTNCFQGLLSSTSWKWTLQVASLTDVLLS